MADVDDKIEELREATKRANEALKDLKRERQAVATMIVDAVKDVERLIGEEAKVQVEGLRQSTVNAIKTTEQRIFARFDRLVEALMGKEGAVESLEMLAMKLRERHSG